MKNVITLFLLICNCSCNSQVYKELEGCWLPEKYVLAVKSNDENNLDSLLFPVEAFQIFKKDAIKFVKDNNSDLENKDTLDVDNFVLIKTYKSEYNGFHIERINHEGKSKYRIPYFYEGLNMKYIPKNVVEQFKTGKIFFSKIGNKLLLEIVINGKQKKILFINEINNHFFNDFEDAKKYLRTK